MGMFDSFWLDDKIKCPICKDYEIGPDFQTKDLDCTLANFKIGKITAYYKYRAETDEELKAKMDKYKQENPNASERLIKVHEFCGSLKKTDEIVGVVKDGVYECHDYCEKCKNLIHFLAIVEGGIFGGIIHESHIIGKKEENINAEIKKA